METCCEPFSDCDTFCHIKRTLKGKAVNITSNAYLINMTQVCRTDIPTDNS